MSDELAESPPEVEAPPEDREDLARLLHRLVDEALESDRLPPGLEDAIASEATAPVAAGGDDLYAVWSSLTALTGEVKLQGRAFKELTTTLSPLAAAAPGLDALAGGQRQLCEEVRGLAGLLRESQRERRQQAEDRARRDSLEALLDVRERLLRSVQTARAQLEGAQRRLGSSSRWLDTLFAGGRTEQASRAALEAAAALEEGCRLGLERLEEALRRQGVHPIQCLGRPFDPQTMTAVDVETVEEPALDGVVRAVYREGYVAGEALLRPAQVRVGRRASAPPGCPPADSPLQGDAP
ncbi:MAG: nucleotide exchange factor GrpE [Candidatus Riflebacteria bacterium]|nr:nucleotide exchange factor GrpE [Candidatus Riflebacteria bacterium]